LYFFTPCVSAWSSSPRSSWCDAQCTVTVRTVQEILVVIGAAHARLSLRALGRDCHA
jgi:hypothetical protein